MQSCRAPSRRPRLAARAGWRAFPASGGTTAGQGGATVVASGRLGPGPRRGTPRERPTALSRGRLHGSPPQPNLAWTIRRVSVGRDTACSSIHLEGVVEPWRDERRWSDDGKRGPRGYDGGKRVKGRKRHLLVDTEGLVHELLVHPANVQDRDGAQLLLGGKSREDFPRMRKLWVDSGYAGQCKGWLEENFGWEVEVVRRPNEGRQRWYGLPPVIERPPLPRGFMVVARRWVVERTFGWLNLFRRLSKDYEQKPASSEAFIWLA
ncbi:IS5 family transposase [Myxococcaceae bacterium GXIMD 01537]